MKTNELIDRLAKGGAPRFAPLTDRAFVGLFAGVLFALTAFSVLVLPVRPDFGLQLHHFYFYSETMLWLGLFVIAGLIAYRSGLPSVPIPRLQRIFWTLLLLLSLGLLVREGLWPAPDTLVDELELFRGRCGGLILAYGLIAGGGFSYWMRGKASVRPRTTALWIGLATATWGSFVMQFICFQENPLHVLLWHFLPTAVLAGGMALLGHRLIRW